MVDDDKGETDHNSVRSCRSLVLLVMMVALSFYIHMSSSKPFFRQLQRDSVSND